jgi:hypothetical protein
LFTFIASLINLLVIYFLAQRQAFIAVAMALGVIGTLMFLALYHTTLSDVVTSLIAGGFWTLLLIALIGSVWGKLGKVTRLPTSVVSPTEL